MLTTRKIAKMLDHSLLKPERTVDQMVEGCRLVHHYRVAAARVKPSELARASEELEGSGVLPTTVVGFPHGPNRTEVKVLET